MTRAKTSRPTSSVPNQCPADGASRARSTLTEKGDWLAKTLGEKATTANTRNKRIPIIRSGSRFNLCIRPTPVACGLTLDWIAVVIADNSTQTNPGVDHLV